MPTRDELRQSQPKHPKADAEQQQQRLEDLKEQSTTAITTLAQGQASAISAQVLALDARLTQFEQDTAKVLAMRLKQSPLRIQHYLVEELSTAPDQSQDLTELIDAFLEVPDLTGDFLAIAPTSVAGCLPL